MRAYIFVSINDPIFAILPHTWAKMTFIPGQFAETNLSQLSSNQTNVRVTIRCTCGTGSSPWLAHLQTSITYWAHPIFSVVFCLGIRRLRVSCPARQTLVSFDGVPNCGSLVVNGCNNGDYEADANAELLYATSQLLRSNQKTRQYTIYSPTPLYGIEDKDNMLKVLASTHNIIKQDEQSMLVKFTSYKVEQFIYSHQLV